jgi:hypothetical protein
MDINCWLLVDRLLTFKADSDSCTNLTDSIEFDYPIIIINNKEMIIPEKIPIDLLWRKHGAVTGSNPVPRRCIIEEVEYIGSFTKIFVSYSDS